MAEWSFKVTDVADSDLNRIGEPVKARVLEKLKWFSLEVILIKLSPNRWELGGGNFLSCALATGGWHIPLNIRGN